MRRVARWRTETPIGKISNSGFLRSGVLGLLAIALTVPARAQGASSPDPVYKKLHSASTWSTPAPSVPTPSTGFTVLGRWPWGPCEAVDVSGNYVYIGNGPSFHVLDVSNPSTPTLVGEYVTDGYVYDIKVRNSRAYVCIGRALIVMDVSNPQVPIKLGEQTFGGGALRVVPADSFAYVTTIAGAFVVVDVSNPSLPRRRGVVGIGPEFLTCLALSGRYAYVGSWESTSLYAVDATDPDTLRVQEVFAGVGQAISGFVRDTLLCTVGSDTGAVSALKIYTISNHTLPLQLGRVTIPDNPSYIINRVTVSDSLAYIVSQDSGVYAVNVANPSLPIVVSRIRHNPRLTYGTGIAETNGKLYVAHFSGLWVIDAAQSDSLRSISFFPTGGYANIIRTRDNYAFIASAFSGLWILDVSNPQQPQPVSNLQMGGYTADVLVSDSLAYLANWSAYSPDTLPGLWTVSIANLSQPRVLGHHKGIARSGPGGFGHENSLAKQGCLLFMTEVLGDSVYEIIDVSNPRQPQSVSVFRAGYHPYYSAVKDSFAYLTTPDSGLRILDVHNPSAPVEVASILSSALGITLGDSLAFVMGGNADFYVISVTNPRAPYIVGSAGSIYNSATSFRMVVQNNFVYWSEFRLGVIDVGNPQQPVQRAVYDPITFSVIGVAVKGDTVYITGNQFGLWILRTNITTGVGNKEEETLPSRYELYQNYPDPFNPVTNIKFSIPKRSALSIRVFNILGQRVATLIEGVVDAGTRMVSFDASSLSSGVYFYRMTAPGASITKKMVLVR